MAEVDVAAVGFLGLEDTSSLPAKVDVAVAGFVGTPFQALPPKVDVTTIEIRGQAFTTAAKIDVTSIGFVGSEWVPAPVLGSGMWLFTANGLWKEVELTLL